MWALLSAVKGAINSHYLSDLRTLISSDAWIRSSSRWLTSAGSPLSPSRSFWRCTG